MVKAISFHDVAELWSSLTAGRSLKWKAFVVEKKMDALLVEDVDIEDPFRPDVLGRGRTIAWAYIECPNGDKMVAKIKQSASREDVNELLERFIEIASA